MDFSSELRKREAMEQFYRLASNWIWLVLGQQDLGIWNHLGVVVNWLLGKLLVAYKKHLEKHLGKLLGDLLGAYRKHLGKHLGNLLGACRKHL
jgi:hypothetical protein